MKMINRLWVLLPFNLWHLSGKAQIPVEISAGHSSYYYQHAFGGRFHVEKTLRFLSHFFGYGTL